MQIAFQGFTSFVVLIWKEISVPALLQVYGSRHIGGGAPMMESNLRGIHRGKGRGSAGLPGKFQLSRIVLE